MSKLTESKKWLICFYSVILFAIIASPCLFKLVNLLTSAIGLSIADKNGCPNIYGLIIHTIVFILLIRLMMVIPLPDV